MAGQKYATEHLNSLLTLNCLLLKHSHLYFICCLYSKFSTMLSSSEFCLSLVLGKLCLWKNHQSKDFYFNLGNSSQINLEDPGVSTIKKKKIPNPPSLLIKISCMPISINR